jgi:hypothetical protein
LLVTGFPISDRYTSFLNPPSGSRSDSSESRFFVSTSVERFGIDDERFACMFVMRFCPRKSVRRRGWSGKFPSCAMSLSVRSIASLS